MSAQSEALRLADDMANYWNERGPDAEAVAAELRRLVAENEALRAQRDQILEALQTVEWHGAGSCWVVDADKIAAAIDAARSKT